jgi:hypothetical protein
MWNCRFLPAWGSFSPGRLANNAALEHALDDPRCREFDWMRGGEPYKESVSNHRRTAQDLLAWSSPWLMAEHEGPRRLKVALKQARDRHGGLNRAWLATKRLRDVPASLRRSAR